MSPAQSARPNLQYLKKLAKKRLKSLRRQAPHTKLAQVQLALAREQGFASWRKLKAESQSAQPTTAPAPADFLKAIARGDLSTVEAILAAHRELVNATGPHPNWGGHPQPLHVAIEAGNRRIFDALLAAGADMDGNNAQ